jgi:hypothetical protein
MSIARCLCGQKELSMRYTGRTRRGQNHFGRRSGKDLDIQPQPGLLDAPVMVERPTYNSTAGDYGATDTFGFQPLLGDQL